MTDQAQNAAPAGPASSLRVFRPSRLRPGPTRVRLQTLVRLRWLAVAGQSVAVLGVDLGFGFPLPLGWCLAVIAVSAWFNVFLTLRFPANLRLRNRYAALILGYDIVQLALLLALTGGLENPFSLLFLVPTTISAATLHLRRTLWLMGLALACISAVALFHLPLPWRPGETLDLPAVYVGGIWTALVCGLAFTGIYAWRIAHESRRMYDALAATELVLAHEQQLSALDGLAAAAAHELGTPLATIALVAKELKREASGMPEISDDLDLLNSQAQRCREILATLTARGAAGDDMLAQLPVSNLLREISSGQDPGDIRLETSATPRPGADGLDEPVIRRSPALLYGLTNLVKNALDFAQARVALEADWNEQELSIVISDDGPGFELEVLKKLGEPYVTTRPPAGNAGAGADGGVGDAMVKEGMGLGFFIAKTLLERTGANLSLANKSPSAGGAVVRIDWPRGAIENVRPHSTNGV
jgi:two-component system sensor histidine kinase RegB